MTCASCTERRAMLTHSARLLVAGRVWDSMQALRPLPAHVASDASRAASAVATATAAALARIAR